MDVFVWKTIKLILRVRQIHSELQIKLKEELTHVPGQPDFGHHPGYLNDPRYEWIGDFCEQHGARQKRITPKELGCLFIGLVLFIIFATVGLNYWGPKEIRESISLNSIIDAIKPPPAMTAHSLFNAFHPLSPPDKGNY